MWLILQDAGRTPRGQLRVLARCSCGVEKVVTHDSILRGLSKTCGCTKRKHMHTTSRNGRPSTTYVSWQAMKTRCSNSNSVDYSSYGGRGITYDPAWESFDNFLRDLGEKPRGTSIDRINVDGNYTPDNCRWATFKQQRANQRQHKRSVHVQDNDL